MRIQDDIKLDFDDVLMCPKQSLLESRSEVGLKREFSFLYSSKKLNCIPIVAANMASVSSIDISKIMGSSSMMTALPKDADYWQDIEVHSHSFMTVGYKDFPKDTTKHPDMLCLDVANGYMDKFFKLVKRARKAFPDTIIVAGNVCTPEATERLIFEGADIVKVGIGGGSGCTTRMKAGVGYPQLSAIIECADAAHGLKGFVMADGGCRSPADICKAFGAGADFVMLGGMLAGHDENPGEVVIKDNQKFKEFYGMSSHLAQERHNGGIKDYRSSEGREILIPYRGSIKNTINDILGGLRSCCAYCGAEKLKELPKRTTFVRVNRQLNGIFERNSGINE